MFAEAVANTCLDETGAGRISDRAREVVLIAIATADPDRAAWKRKIRAEYRSRNQNCGSIFLLVVLPILISLISQWLGRWIWKTDPAVLTSLQADAASALG